MFVGAAFQATAVAWAIQIVHAEGTGLGRWDLALPLALGGAGLGLLVVPLVDVALATVAQHAIASIAKVRLPYMSRSLANPRVEDIRSRSAGRGIA